MKKYIQFLIFLTSGIYLNSCGVMIDQMVDSAIQGLFGSSSSSKKEDPIESDTARLNNDEPLKYYRSESKLNAARQDRFLNEIMSSTED